jgi:hypothetical protein
MGRRRFVLAFVIGTSCFLAQFAPIYAFLTLIHVDDLDDFIDLMTSLIGILLLIVLFLTVFLGASVYKRSKHLIAISTGLVVVYDLILLLVSYNH